MSAIFQDTWTGTTGVAWEPLKWINKATSNGITASIFSNQGRLRKNTGTTSHYFAMQALTSSMTDLSIYFDVNIRSYVSKAIAVSFRGDGTYAAIASQANCYFLNLNPLGNSLVLAKRTSGVSTTLATGALSMAAQDIVHVRIQVVGNNIKMRGWVNGNSEPATWNVDYTDATNYRTSGFTSVGLTTAVDSDEVYLDNFTISDPSLPVYDLLTKVWVNGAWVSGSWKSRQAGSWS